MKGLMNLFSIGLGMVGWFVEVCRRRGLEFNADKSNVMVLNGEKRLKY